MEKTIVVSINPKNEVLDNLRNKYCTMLESKKSLVLPIHFTLLGRFKTNKYEEFLSEIKQICSEIKKFNLEINHIDALDNPKIVFAHIKKTNLLQKIHESFLKICKKYRLDWARETLFNMAETEEQKELVKEYGSPFVKQFYNPHITLAGPDVNYKFSKLDFPIKLKETIFVDTISIMTKENSEWLVCDEIKLN